MEYIAKTELGIGYKEFYSLTWYDWSGCMEQIAFQRKIRLEQHEVMYDVCRRLLAQYYNWNRGNNAEVSPEDFLRLSWDRKDTQIQPQDEEKLKETIKKLERAAQKRINKRRGG